MSSLVRWPVPQPAKVPGPSTRIITPPAAPAGPADLFLVGADIAAASTAVTSYTGPSPATAGAQAGDLLLLLCCLGLSTPPAISSTGYSAVNGSDVTNGVTRTTWLQKTAGGGESAPTIDHATAAQGSCVLLVFRNQDTGTPMDVDCTNTPGGGAVTTVLNPNVTTVTDGALPVAQAVTRVGTGAVGTLSVDAGYTEAAEAATSAGSGANIATAGYVRGDADGTPVAIGTYDGATFTATVAGRMTAIHGAVRPAAGGGAQPPTWPPDHWGQYGGYF